MKYYETTDDYVKATLEAKAKDLGCDTIDLVLEYLLEDDSFMDNLAEDAEKYGIALDDEYYEEDEE